MNVRTPLGLFVGIVIAGSPLAVGVGMAYAASQHDGFIPQPTKSPGVIQDFGTPKTIPTPVTIKTTAPERRVESETYTPEVVKQAPEETTNSTRAQEATNEPTTPSTELDQPEDPPSTGQTASPPGPGTGAGGPGGAPAGPNDGPVGVESANAGPAQNNS